MASRIGAKKSTSSVTVTNKCVMNENKTRSVMPGKATVVVKETRSRMAFGLKRKAEPPVELPKSKKRSAFGDITNAIDKNAKVTGKKECPARLAKSKVLPAKPSKIVTRVVGNKKQASLVETVASGSTQHTKEDLGVLCESLPTSFGTNSSQETSADSDESSYFVSASEGSPILESLNKLTVSEPEQLKLPADVEDYDSEMKDDPYSVALYAQDIFLYYKSRENCFKIDRYMDRQPEVSRTMRSILVDWMVEVQESFELNHETLYLGVKMVDLYLSKMLITRDNLQLVGSTAMFIACKFEERIPQHIDDFLYICDDAYTRKEIITMEIKMLKTVGFDLGFPLSYHFLRRFARCSKMNMEDLTLARYILEMSLLEYDLVDSSDSALAAAALLLAREMKGQESWSPTLTYYSGYNVSDISPLVHQLHAMLQQPSRDCLKTIRSKYSHKVFFEVASLPVPANILL